MRNKKLLLGVGVLAAMILCAGCAVPTSVQAPLTSQTPLTQAPLPIDVDGSVATLGGSAAVDMANALNAADSLVSVQTNGTYKTKPDIAYVSFAVETQNANAKTAQEQNKKKVDDVLNALKAAGITEKDMQTLNYSVYPQYNYGAGTQKLTGYSVSNSVQVTLNAVDKVGERLDTIVNAGATNINNVYFGLKDITAAQTEAIKDAVKKAGINANALCAAASVKLGDVVHISFGTDNAQPYYYARDYGMTKAEAAADTGAPTVINSGDIDVQVSVSVTYRFGK